MMLKAFQQISWLGGKFIKVFVKFEIVFFENYVGLSLEPQTINYKQESGAEWEKLGQKNCE